MKTVPNVSERDRCLFVEAVQLLTATDGDHECAFGNIFNGPHDGEPEVKQADEDRVRWTLRGDKAASLIEASLNSKKDKSPFSRDHLTAVQHISHELHEFFRGIDFFAKRKVKLVSTGGYAV